ncbi:MAG TPA: glycosyltransferase family 2 protein [Candidatus Kapabacteria bacterium]|nr:glycosyltransferase family 2 protein [Candidatus Kapabacteria bacterium]
MNISIIIPTFNREKLLKQLLLALRNDKASNAAADIEVIVINDRSTDGTEQMVKNEFPEIVYLTADGKGDTSAKRVGIEAAKGDYVVSLDDDMIPENGWIRDVIPTLEQGKPLVQTKIVFRDLGQQNLRDESRQYFRTGFKFNMYPVLVINGGYKEQYINICAECGLFISRDLLKKIPLDDPNLISDFGEAASFFLRINKQGYKVFFQPQSILYHLGADTGGGKEREGKVPPRKQCTPFVTMMVHNFFIFARMSNPWRIPYMVGYYSIAGLYLSFMQKRNCFRFFIKGIIGGLTSKRVPVHPYSWAHE